MDANDTIATMETLLRSQRATLERVMRHLERGGATTLWGDVNEADRLADLLQRRLDDVRHRLPAREESSAGTERFPPRGPGTCICADPENCTVPVKGCRAGHRARTSEHVCGLAGYNGMIDPPCPACESNRELPSVGEP